MSADWLLVETLGDQPLVVAEGRRVRSSSPLGLFLRRSPHLAAIQTAIAETVASGIGLASITPKSKRVIRTEPVRMTDGRIHAVHVWCGPTDEVPPERAIPGPLEWDFTTGEGSASSEYLANAGLDPSQDSLADRRVDQDERAIDKHVEHSGVIDEHVEHSGVIDEHVEHSGVHSWVGDAELGRTYCATWEFIDSMGSLRRVGWWARTLAEQGEDGREHLVVRGMNLVEAISEGPVETPGQARPQSGEHHVVIDAKTWELLNWLDNPRSDGRQRRTPEVNHVLSEQLSVDAPTGAVPVAIRGALRIPNEAGGEMLLHVRVSRTELADGTIGGLVKMQQPADSGLSDTGGSSTG